MTVGIFSHAFLRGFRFPVLSEVQIPGTVCAVPGICHPKALRPGLDSASVHRRNPGSRQSGYPVVAPPSRSQIELGHFRGADMVSPQVLLLLSSFSSLPACVAPPPSTMLTLVYCYPRRPLNRSLLPPLPAGVGGLLRHSPMLTFRFPEDVDRFYR